MKLKTLWPVTFLTFFIVIKADRSIPSFLKFIGSYKYNTTNNGQITLKRYYSSHRVTYKWIEANRFCKSVGMRMALIETNAELNNIAAMGRKNSKLFDKKVFVDGYNLTVIESLEDDYPYGSKREPCYSLQKFIRGKLEVHSESCNSELQKFLCEKTEIVDSYEENLLSDDKLGKLDVRATFFTYIGNFETKKYYASFKWKAHSNNVPKICQSFGMQMVSPKNQTEYDNLAHLLHSFRDEWYSVSIAGYRSDENESEWVVANERLNYDIDWNDGEPNNSGGEENCIALQNMGAPRINDFPCNTDVQFVCEFDESITDVNIPSEIDPMFLKPLTNYKIGSTKKELFVSLFDVDWITATMMCRSFGMELFTPSSVADDETLRTKLMTVADISNSLHVGITSMGMNNLWYSVNDGKIIDFDLEWSRQDSNYYQPNVNCLQLTKTYGKYSYDDIACVNTFNRFICQLVDEVTHDEQITTQASVFPSFILSTTNTIPDPVGIESNY